MEFLYKLYEQKYFGPSLLGAIIFLSILFLIVLFAGKKDKNKRLEETKKLELAAINEQKYKEVDENTKEIKVPEIAQPNIEKTENVMEQPFVLNEENLASDDNPKEDSVTVSNDINELEKNLNMDLDSLFDANNVQEEINPANQVSPVEMKEEQNSIPFELPKVAEMPKLKEEKKEIQENIFGEVTQDNNIFSNIENETYNLK
ncbi:MAG: hypothetical protein E7158_03430 [Firmicutes bacterium]|nr:hypothetical protein [Bacillota bacterium]